MSVDMTKAQFSSTSPPFLLKGPYTLSISIPAGDTIAAGGYKLYESTATTTSAGRALSYYAVALDSLGLYQPIPGCQRGDFGTSAELEILVTTNTIKLQVHCTNPTLAVQTTTAVTITTVVYLFDY